MVGEENPRARRGPGLNGIGGRGAGKHGNFPPRDRLVVIDDATIPVPAYPP